MENECQSTEIGLKKQGQTGSVTGDIYNVQSRLENVSRRLTLCEGIAQRNKELIWKFCDHCRLQGLSALRVVFYLNRFWNIARLADKDFDRMTRKEIEELARKIQTKGVATRTASDHLTAIKTFWKWLENTGDTYPEKVGWINPSRRSAACKLPEELLSKEDIERLVNAAINPRDKALISILYESGCSSVCDVGADLRDLENKLFPVLLEISEGEVHAMLELIGKAMNGSLEQRDIDLSPLKVVLADCAIPSVCSSR